MIFLQETTIADLINNLIMVNQFLAKDLIQLLHRSAKSILESKHFISLLTRISSQVYASKQNIEVLIN